MIVVALGLLVAASGPFDQALRQARGAHLVATYDATKAPADQLARTAQRPGVQGAAGPFRKPWSTAADRPDELRRACGRAR